ncbi:glycerophosphodiester phosphodiesterase [Halobacteria archaeon HArc-gm2]|nr:glycerophosphodiester phosphodiesterase [Halobacteria archaeon HArc-gm2]
MRCIAHRGFAGEFAENTVGAVASAAEIADWVEVDVRRCGSGELVVVHDETVDRVTDATGEVAELSQAELAQLNVLGSGEGIPTLAEVLEVLPPSVGINVDLKENGLATDAVDVLGAHDGGVLVSSFDAGVLAEVTVLADYPRALLVEADPEERLARAADLNCTAIHPHWDICDERFVSRAHDANLTVNAWTIRDSVGAVSARNAGVDGFITDHSEFCAE